MKKFLRYLFVASWAAGLLLGAYRPEPETREEEYTVQAGDTAWTVLSQKVSDRHDVRDYIYRTLDRNGIKAGMLKPGQRIVLVLPAKD